MDFEVLVKKARQGDKDALVQLIMAQKQDYYKLAYVYMQNQEDALDAMEDMIVLLYENIHSLKREAAFYSWSKTILVNCCRKSLRKRKKVIFLDTLPEEASQEVIQSKDDQMLVEKYLSQLPARQQEVLRLRYFLDLDYQSMAELLKIPLGTVKSRLSTGLKQLQKSMGGEESERL